MTPSLFMCLELTGSILTEILIGSYCKVACTAKSIETPPGFIVSAAAALLSLELQFTTQGATFAAI